MCKILKLRRQAGYFEHAVPYLQITRDRAGAQRQHRLGAEFVGILTFARQPPPDRVPYASSYGDS